MVMPNNSNEQPYHQLEQVHRSERTRDHNRHNDGGSACGVAVPLGLMPEVPHDQSGQRKHHQRREPSHQRYPGRRGLVTTVTHCGEQTLTGDEGRE